MSELRHLVECVERDPADVVVAQIHSSDRSQSTEGGAWQLAEVEGVGGAEAAQRGADFQEGVVVDAVNAVVAQVEGAHAGHVRERAAVQRPHVRVHQVQLLQRRRELGKLTYGER